MDAARLHLDAVIAPTRSLPMRGFKILLGAVIALNLIVGTGFVLLGAAPVPIFLGLDVLGVGLAFYFSYRQARARERVQVTADQVRVTRERGSRSQEVWTSPTAFTRVDLAETGRYGQEVRLMLSGRRVTIGRMLGPQERAGLADRIEQAIRAARAERYPS